jgi:hypothetical protein
MNLPFLARWLIFLVLCAACSSANPSTSPYLGTGFSLRNSSDPNNSLTLCVDVYLGAFAEGNQRNSAVENQVGRTLQFQLDGENIDLSWSGSIDTMYRILTWCLDTAPLSIGVHTLTAQASTTSGVVHSQSWEFEVRESEPPLILTPEATATP